MLTKQISGSLYISGSIVQGNLSNVFAKGGTKSRRELLEHLFLDNLSPQIAAYAVSFEAPYQAVVPPSTTIVWPVM